MVVPGKLPCPIKLLSDWLLVFCYGLYDAKITLKFQILFIKIVTV